MNSDSLVEELKESLSLIERMQVKYSRMSNWKRVIELEGKLNGLIYVKTRTDVPYTWGITKNTVDRIKKTDLPWCVILLYKSSATGYLISPSEYEKKVQSNLWSFAQGDYKISDGANLAGIANFTDAGQLLNILSSHF